MSKKSKMERPVYRILHYYLASRLNIKNIAKRRAAKLILKLEKINDGYPNILGEDVSYDLKVASISASVLLKFGGSERDWDNFMSSVEHIFDVAAKVTVD